VAGETAQAKRAPLEIAGVTATPHNRAESMRYIRNPGKAEGALVRLFVRNANSPSLGKVAMCNVDDVRFNKDYPLRLIMDAQWTWFDLPSQWPEHERAVPPGAITVWTFNAIRPPWTAGNKITLSVEDWMADRIDQISAEVPVQKGWLSAVTFLSSTGSVQPDTMIFHIDNQSSRTVRVTGARLYLPKSQAAYRVFHPQPPLKDIKTFPADAVIPPGDKGGASVATGLLPLTYTVLEVTLTDPAGKTFSLWARLRIKREVFDISGGWIGGAAADGKSALTHEPVLKTYKRLHINTGHIGLIPGYTDRTGPDGLYTHYPIKFFRGLEPIERWDTDAMLPRIHAVECLGEPQFGGGRGQRLPQEVFRALEPYAATRLATTVTLSDESNWRYYAGLSDYPHYDAYRVTAPSADFWVLYDRWGGTRIAWGSPLETIGDMCRSLRELSRPAPTAYWSQACSSGWEGYGGRKRTSPTADEIRLQAYHALASRITSLYWFNPSLKALVDFRDTIDELTRIGREIRMLDQFYVEGDAYRYRRTRRGGKPDWDLASIASPRGALLFALDLDYLPDPKEKVFVFGPPRQARFAFDLPVYLRKPVDVFRIDADGVYEATWKATKAGIEITDKQTKVAVYVASPDRALRTQLERKRQALVAEENSVGFDPARSDTDFAVLKALARDD